MVSLASRDGNFTVYDLEVEEDHTYAITPLGIVVHNAGHKACELVAQILGGVGEVLAATKIPISLIPKKALDFGFVKKLENLLSKNPEAHARAIKTLENLTVNKRLKANAVQVHHWFNEDILKAKAQTKKFLDDWKQIMDDKNLEKLNNLIQADWNKSIVIGHAGRHPRKYIEDRVRTLGEALTESKGDMKKFESAFKAKVSELKSEILTNPSILYKDAKPIFILE